MIEIILSRCVSFVSFYLELINASVELFIWRFDYTAAELIHILNVSTLVSMIHGFSLNWFSIILSPWFSFDKQTNCI